MGRRGEREMKCYLVLISLVAFAACGQNTLPTSNQILKAPTDSINAAPVNSFVPNAAPSDKPKVKTGNGRGVVTKINLELGSVELNHEEIKGMMPAMRMEFYVSDKKMLDNLKIGDKVDFILEDNAGAERIISIEKK